MTTSLRRAATTVAVVAFAASIAACGSSSQSAGTSGSTTPASSSSSSTKKPGAGEVYKQARQSALGAKSGHVSGTVSEGGSTTSIDLRGTVDGSNQKVTFAAPAQGSFTLLTVGGKNWVQGDKKFWTTNADAATATKLVGKYVAVPASQAKSFGDTNLKGLLTEMFSDKSLSTLESLATAVTETDVNGTKAYVLQDRGADDGQVFVTADGKAQLLKIVGPKTDAGTLTFTEWDAVPAFSAPPAAQVITSP